MPRIGKIEECRASEAFECVNKQVTNEENTKDELKEYKAYIKKLPMLIKVNGLGPALAFVYSRKNKKKAYEWLYNDIQKWIRDSSYLSYMDIRFKGELVNDIINLDSQEYRAVTKEILAFLNWLKRFADGSIEGDVSGE